MKLSIITINYNNAQGLEKTIKSVVSQNLRDFEYIVIDGNSTDGSKDIIKTYEDRIHYWISESDSGIYNAMNKGIRQANGEYLLFLNSGDFLNDEDSLRTVLFELNTGMDIVFFDMVLVDAECNKSFIKKYPDFVDLKHMILDAIPHQASFIKRKTLIDYGGYNENTNIISDWIFFLDAIIFGNASYKHINQVFSSFNLDGISSKAENVPGFIEERYEYIKNHHVAFYQILDEWRSQENELKRIRNSQSYKLSRKIANIIFNGKKLWKAH
ncbi:MAG: glycosyltransferase family 2 protein [Dysgonomonas sp.]